MHQPREHGFGRDAAHQIQFFVVVDVVLIDSRLGAQWFFSGCVFAAEFVDVVDVVLLFPDIGFAVFRQRVGAQIGPAWNQLEVAQGVPVHLLFLGELLKGGLSGFWIETGPRHQFQADAIGFDFFGARQVFVDTVVDDHGAGPGRQGLRQTHTGGINGHIVAPILPHVLAQVVGYFMRQDEGQFVFCEGQVLDQTAVDHHFARTHGVGIHPATVHHMDFPIPSGGFRMNHVHLRNQALEHGLNTVILVLHGRCVQQTLCAVEAAVGEVAELAHHIGGHLGHGQVLFTIHIHGGGSGAAAPPQSQRNQQAKPRAEARGWQSAIRF